MLSRPTRLHGRARNIEANMEAWLGARGDTSKETRRQVRGNLGGERVLSPSRLRGPNSQAQIGTGICRINAVVQRSPHSKIAYAMGRRRITEFLARSDLLSRQARTDPLPQWRALLEARHRRSLAESSR